MHSSIFLFVALLLTDWAQFRGPNSDAHVVETQTPMEWSDTKNVEWKVDIPGLGWSSPVVVDGCVYLTTAVAQGEGLSLRVMSLSEASGKLIWDREFKALDKAPAIHAKNSHASPTPIVRNGSVYVHFGAQGMAKLDCRDGSIQWKNEELVYPPMHGSGGSPVLADGKLVIVCDGSVDPFVACVDAETGKTLWKTLRSIKASISHSFVTPAVTMVDGKLQVLAPGPDHFAAYDLNDGNELWRVLAPGWSVVPQPTIGHGLVFYNHDYDHPELMAVKLGGQGDVTEKNVVWRIKTGAPSTPTPLLVGDELYFVSDKGIASCVDAKTGERHWMERLGGNYSVSPVFANGNILFMDEDGKASWVKPGKAFEVIGTCEVTGRTFATPAFANQAMFLRTDQQLLKISSR